MSTVVCPVCRAEELERGETSHRHGNRWVRLEPKTTLLSDEEILAKMLADPETRKRLATARTKARRK